MMATPNYYQIDSYDKLFCKCDGTATSFVDSSTANPKTITANGNATQLPIKFNKSAGFLADTYVVVPIHNEFQFGTGEWDIEFFVNWSVIGTQPCPVSIGESYSGEGKGISVTYYPTDSKWYIYVSGTAYSSTFQDTALTTNTWYHVRVQRDGNDLKVFRDGSQIGTSADITAKNITGITKDVWIGKATNSYPNAYTFTGWLKELRISNTARTNAVPTSEYSDDANTVLLMHFDTPATNPLAPAIYFDGTGDYLSVADSADWDFGTGAFTIAGFVNTSNNATANQTIISTNQNSGGFRVLLASSTSLTVILAGTTHTFTLPTVATASWHHFEVSRDGSSNLTLFWDGRLIETKAGANQDVTGSATALEVGRDANATSLYFNGFMREIYIKKGAQDHSASFVPPLTSMTVDSNTKLYIKGNENNGVTTFVDSETSPKTVTTNSDCKIKYTEDYRSRIFKDETGKFPYPVGSAKVDFFAIGSGVGYFDGTGDYLSIPDSDDWDFGSGAFTLESYCRLNSLGAARTIFIRSNANYEWNVIIDASNQLLSYSYSGGSQRWAINGGAIIKANEWFHVSLVRNGNAQYLFFNGQKVGTDGSYAGAMGDGSDPVWIGANYTPNNYWLGLLDNIRISKGIARYTATFNPPEFIGSTLSQILWVD